MARSMSSSPRPPAPGTGPHPDPVVRTAQVASFQALRPLIRLVGDEARWGNRRLTPLARWAAAVPDGSSLALLVAVADPSHTAAEVLARHLPLAALDRHVVPWLASRLREESIASTPWRALLMRFGADLPRPLLRAFWAISGPEALQDTWRGALFFPATERGVEPLLACWARLRPCPVPMPASYLAGWTAFLRAPTPPAVEHSRPGRRRAGRHATRASEARTTAARYVALVAGVAAMPGLARPALEAAYERLVAEADLAIVPSLLRGLLADPRVTGAMRRAWLEALPRRHALVRVFAADPATLADAGCRARLEADGSAAADAALCRHAAGTPAFADRWAALVARFPGAASTLLLTQPALRAFVPAPSIAPLLTQGAATTRERLLLLVGELAPPASGMPPAPRLVRPRRTRRAR